VWVSWCGDARARVLDPRILETEIDGYAEETEQCKLHKISKLHNSSMFELPYYDRNEDQRGDAEPDRG